MKTPYKAVCITNNKEKNKAGFSFSCQENTTVKGPIIPVNNTKGLLRPSTPSNRETPKFGAHSYSSISLKPLPEPERTKTIKDMMKVNNVVANAMYL